ncbi:MAG TPA: FmdB family zinc ribbon protein [Fimbriimonadaceae bacterium]|nr:FmdB family zinc ribbon protein [Fimbriimonadaceae bacterium]
MPTYVYECSHCSEVFEVEQRITESPLDVCRCGSKGTVKRLIQPVGVMFKGAGFHINDYASSSAPAKSAERSESPGESAGACKEGT